MSRTGRSGAAAESLGGIRRHIAFGLLLALLLYIAWVIRAVLLIIYVSIVFAVVFYPLVRWVERLRIFRWQPNRGAAVLLLLAAALGVLALVVALVLPPLANDLQQLGGELPSRIGQMADRLRQFPFGDRLADALQPGALGSHLAAFAKRALQTVQGFAGALVQLVTLAILVAYFILDAEQATNWTLSLVPVQQRDRLRRTLGSGARRMQRWLAGQATLMLILGSASFVVFWVLGVRYFYALALFAGIANFVPILGPLATVVLAGIVAALDSWMKVLGVLIFYGIYQQVENAYLTPHIMKSTVALPAVAVIVALAVGAELAGIWGAIIAVPTAAMLATVADEYLVQHDRDAERRRPQESAPERSAA